MVVNGQRLNETPRRVSGCTEMERTAQPFTVTTTGNERRGVVILITFGERSKRNDKRGFAGYCRNEGNRLGLNRAGCPGCQLLTEPEIRKQKNAEPLPGFRPGFDSALCAGLWLWLWVIRPGL